MRSNFTQSLFQRIKHESRIPLVFLLVSLSGAADLASQTLTELVVPKYIGSKSGASTNNSRTPFAVCLQIDGLLSNTIYDIRANIGLVTDAPTVWGAGNLWTGTDFSGSIALSVFTTDATGSSGPFWLYIQPTGNGTRFDAGQQHNLRIGYRITGGSFSSGPSFVGTKIFKALDIATNPRTPSVNDDGCFVKGTSFPISGGRYVLLFDNENGTGDPLYSYMIRHMPVTQILSQPDLPPVINDIYMQTGTSGVGDYPAVIPIGANNPSGVRRVESRNPDNTVFAFNTDPDGIWPGGANTTTPVRREVIILTNTDTPLIPGGPSSPTVVTDTNVMGITHNSAVGGGDVTDQGGTTITARGICWSQALNPSVTDPHSTEPGTTGPFTSNISGLMPNAAYHLRAYAINADDTAYGADVGFSTLCEPYAPGVNFYADKTEIQVGDTVNFFDSTMYCPSSWNWSFVGGIPMTSNLPGPTGIVYTYPGDFNVCLTATNEYGTRTVCKAGYIRVAPHHDPRVVITEIMYNPPESGTDSLEFLELYNNDTLPVNLEGFYFDQGVSFGFPGYVLGAGQYLLVAADSNAMRNTFNVSSLQWSSGALSNSGEKIILKDRSGVTVDSVEFDDISPWDSLADGRGPSLELCDADADNSLGQNWRAAIEFKTVNSNGDTLRTSPLAGCSFIPLAGFTADDTVIFQGGSVIFTSTSTGDIDSYSWEFEGGDPSSYQGESPSSCTIFFNGGIQGLTDRFKQYRIGNSCKTRLYPGRSDRDIHGD